ncbi:MAG TPA: hypothetical protein VHW26_01035 [Solirubrobacteraceae bacterium]|nr:hypothetical protein [Solirubrobacteraceae bacterium]
MATLPAGEPGLRDPGPPPGKGQALDPRLTRGLSLLAFVLVAYLADRIKLYEKINLHQAKHAALPTARVWVAAIVLFVVSGFGVVRLALPESLRRHELLWIAPVGACVAALELTLLGYAFVPFEVSLAIVVLAGIGVGVLAVRRRGMPARPAPVGGTLWPIYIAAIVAALVLCPLFRGGYPTVIGDGSDAHLAAGTAQFLQNDYPLSSSADQPVNKVPRVWRSKTPIYYALGGVASLAGLPTWEALSPLEAVLLALAMVGFFLAARELLDANLLGALAGMALVGLDRMVVHTVVHPYFNQTWGFVTMAPALVLAWRAVADRGRPGNRATLGLLALFLAIGAFAYPLELPIPLCGLIVFNWRSRRARRRAGEDVPKLRPALTARVRSRLGGRGRVAVPVIAVLLAVPVLGVAEKLSTGFAVIVNPNVSLYPWAGDVGAYFPTNQFLSIGSANLLLIGIPLMLIGAGLALWRTPRPVTWGVISLLGLAAVGSWYFHARISGQYFDFKLLAFLGPLAVLTAAVGASRVPVIGWAALAAFGLTAFHGAHVELANTGNQLSPNVRAVARIPALIGPNQSVRLDMDPSLQIWTSYFLHDEPVCSQKPLLATSYPHVTTSRRADYILADVDTFRPFDATGPPIAYVGEFRLYKERADVPGKDRCSKTRVQTVLAIGSS